MLIGLALEVPDIVDMGAIRDEGFRVISLRIV